MTDTLNVHCMPATVLEAGDPDTTETAFTSFTKLTSSDRGRKVENSKRILGIDKQ